LSQFLKKVFDVLTKILKHM